MRWALAALTGATAVAGALAARHEPARTLLGFAGGVLMKAPADSELDLIQVRARQPCANFWGAWLAQVGLTADVLYVTQAHVVFRHGARSPFQDSPDAPKIWVATCPSRACPNASRACPNASHPHTP